MMLGIKFDVCHTGRRLRDLPKHTASNPARSTEGTGELQQGCPLPHLILVRRVGEDGDRFDLLEPGIRDTPNPVRAAEPTIHARPIQAEGNGQH